MKLEDYRLANWKDNKIERQKKVADKRILLLSIDRTILPLKEGRKKLLAVDKENNVV